MMKKKAVRGGSSSRLWRAYEESENNNIVGGRCAFASLAGFRLFQLNRCRGWTESITLTSNPDVSHQRRSPNNGDLGCSRR
jgi:hypothetical protein